MSTQLFIPTTSLLLLLLILLLHHNGNNSVSAEIFKDCGGFLEEPRGVVQSPGFPNRFPVPLACRWVIHAPPEKKIVLYFTQYFLREAFILTEFEEYVSELVYSGRKSLGQINFEDHIRTVVAYKSYVVLDFCLHHMSNIHLRVEEYLEDVYGFNITYEIVDRDKPMRQDTCSVNDCSFLGHCIASADFSTYRCECFSEFFGKECQYGPFCDPDKGINMCLNQGRCRYFYGSLVNMCECPEGYFGPKCEQGEDIIDEDHIASMTSSNRKSPECAKLGCSDHCQRNYEGLLYCSCQDGFKLDSDNTTCIEQELFRVSVAVPLVSRPADWDEEQATTQAISVLQLTGLRTSKRFQFDGVNSSSGQKRQMLHFYVDRSDLDLVQEGVQNLMRRNKLFNLSVVSENLTVRLHPEMKLLSVENYEPEPALEGKSLTLVCTARGSKGLQFRWYKDQFLFNHTLTSRNAWEVRLEDKTEDKQMSIFNIDGVTMFDKGTFSCEIEDFGEVENRSVTVDVMPLPQVEIKPLTANLLPGGALSFRCLSPDENMRTFAYQWLRDGEEEVVGKERVNGEIVEDLWPSGSRLFIPRLHVSANYTCRVVNKAGASQKSAFVYLISANVSEMVCESDSYEGVKWNRTYGGYYDLQICPIDTADFKVVGLGEGYARRDCVCDSTSCAWGPPNYARCHSIHLIYLYEQLERCQLGYQQDGLSRIYNSLYQILRKAQNRTLAGDVDMFAIILHRLFEVALRFPAVAPDPMKSSFSLMTVGRFMNMLLDEVKTTNEFEKRDLSVGARFIRVCEILGELTRENPTLIPVFNLTLPRIGFAVRNVTVLAQNTSDKKGEDGAGVPAKMNTGRQLMSLWADAKPHGEGGGGGAAGSGKQQLKVLQVTYTPDIMAILRVTSSPRDDFKDFLTPLLSVLPVGENGDLLDDSYKLKDGKVELEFAHPTQFPAFVGNITKCVAWDRRDSRQLVGEWRTGVCDVTHRTANATRCLCPVPGHYTVVVIATNLTTPAILPVQRDTVLLIGCVISLCGLVATLLVYFVCWRQMSGDSSMIHSNFILSLAGVNVVCIIFLSHPEGEMLCVLGKMFLHLLQLSAISFLLVEAIHTCVCIQSTGFGGHARIQKTCLKYFLIGWGIPGLATLAVTLLSEAFGYDDNCSSWCWWSAGQWQYYSFLVLLVFMVLVEVIIMSACIVCTRLWRDEHRFVDRRKYIYIAVRSFVLQTLVVLMSVSGHLVETDRSSSHQFFFAFVDILLTMTVLVTLLLSKPHVRRVVFSFILPANKQGLASGSFRAFVLPDRVEDSEQLEVKHIQQYCSDLDRSKFTSQHKQTLRNLLGSSSSGYASGTAGSSPGSLATAAGGGHDTFFARRSHSAGSRSSSSDHGGGAGAGTGARAKTTTGGVRPENANTDGGRAGRRPEGGGGAPRKSRAKRATTTTTTTDPLSRAQAPTTLMPPTGTRGTSRGGGGASPSPSPSPSHSPSRRPMLCQQGGLSPEHDWTRHKIPPAAPRGGGETPRVVVVTGGGEGEEGEEEATLGKEEEGRGRREVGCRRNPSPGLFLLDSGYEGAESDCNPSSSSSSYSSSSVPRQGRGGRGGRLLLSSSYGGDVDSQLSSDLETDLYHHHHSGHSPTTSSSSSSSTSSSSSPPNNPLLNPSLSPLSRQSPTTSSTPAALSLLHSRRQGNSSNNSSSSNSGTATQGGGSRSRSGSGTTTTTTPATKVSVNCDVISRCDVAAAAEVSEEEAAEREALLRVEPRCGGGGVEEEERDSESQAFVTA